MKNKLAKIPLFFLLACAGIAHADTTPAGTVGPTNWAVTATILGVAGIITLVAGIGILGVSLRVGGLKSG